MQMWTRIGSHHLNNLLRNRRYPRRPDMTINVPGLNSPVNMDDNYGLRLTAYYRVRSNFTCPAVAGLGVGRSGLWPT